MKNLNKQIANRGSFRQRGGSRKLVDLLFFVCSLPVSEVASGLMTQKKLIGVSVEPPITDH
jgi:hypothetical protein